MEVDMEFKNKLGELGEGTYECTLDDATLEKAKLELNENPEQRATQIERFRQWVKAQPHMSSRTDDGFLLRYLRIAKFNQEKAQQILDNYWTARTVPGRGAPEWFTNMDPADPENQELVEMAFCIPLPGRDHIGRKVVYINTGGYDPNVISLNEVFRVQLMTIDTLIQDEHTQVHGFVMLLDFSEFTASHVFGWSLDRTRKACRCLQETYPTRNKSINLYNTPTVFNALFDIFMYYVQDKMKERIHFHKDSLESLHREIDSRMLPNELGGTAGTKKELARQWKEELLRNREELLRCSDPKYGIQEDKRPSSESGGAWGWGWTGLF